MKSVPGTERDRAALEFHRRLSGEHVKELPRAHVEVRRFACTRRNPFPNHAECRVFQQMPAVARIAPRVCSADPTSEMLRFMITSNA